MKLTFLGDIMCEPPVLKAAKRKNGTYDFRGVFAPCKKLLRESDYVIANLETPLAGKEAGFSETHLCFNAPDEYADACLDAGIRLISTANNHTFDRGYEGMERTLRILDEKGLAHTGTYLPEEERQEAYYFEADGTKFAVIAYTYDTNFAGYGKNYRAEGAYENSVNLLRLQGSGTYLPGVFRKKNWVQNLFSKISWIKDDNVGGKVGKFFGLTMTYSRHDDLIFPTSAPFIQRMQQDIRTAKEKADLVLFYPHVGGQFNIKPGAFSEYVIDKALEAGADGIVATHSHIPQKLVMRNGVPISYCLGNFNMNPKSYLAMPEILTDYGYALHLYVEKGTIRNVTFSMLKNCVMPDGQIASCPVDELYQALKTEEEKQLLIQDIHHLYGRITGKKLTKPFVCREYACSREDETENGSDSAKETAVK